MSDDGYMKKELTGIPRMKKGIYHPQRKNLSIGKDNVRRNCNKE